jgi:hypothetical protein
MITWDQVAVFVSLNVFRLVSTQGTARNIFMGEFFKKKLNYFLGHIDLLAADKSIHSNPWKK